MKHEHMGWECPKCSRCYSPTVEMCPKCPEERKAKQQKNNEILCEMLSNDFARKKQVDANDFKGIRIHSGNTTSDANTATLTSTHWNACFSYVKKGTSKYCANCGSHEKEHTK